MINPDLKWTYVLLASATLIAVVCVVSVFTSHAELHQQLITVKRIKLSESGALFAAMSDQQRFHQYRESYDAVMADASRFSRNRISLLSYLSTLNADVAPLVHSFAIEPARPLVDGDQHLPPVSVSSIKLEAEFRHENHLFEYLWHIDQQQTALLKVVAVDVSMQTNRQPPGNEDASYLKVQIRLHWFAFTAIEVS